MTGSFHYDRVLALGLTPGSSMNQNPIVDARSRAERISMQMPVAIQVEMFASSVGCWHPVGMRADQNH